MQGTWLKKLVYASVVLALAVAAHITLVSCQPAEQSAKVAVTAADSGGCFVDLLQKSEDGKFSKHGWNHYGPGYFEIDENTGELTSHGGMGLFWYAAQQFGDFVLELDYMTDSSNTNSGIFFRIPNVLASNDYIFECFEIQIYDDTSTTREHAVHDPKLADMQMTLNHATGAIYDAHPPTKFASKGPRQWNHYKITCQGLMCTVELNGEVVNEWQLQPAGKVATHWPKGFIGLQNHDNLSSVHFRNIRVKTL